VKLETFESSKIRKRAASESAQTHESGWYVYLCFFLSLSLSLEIPRQTKAKYFAKVVAKEISLNDHF